MAVTCLARHGARHENPRRHADGRCAECHNARNRKYSKKNASKNAERQRRWRYSDPEKRRAVAAEQARNWRKTESGKRKTRDYNLRRNYGISLGEYEEIAAKQKGLCAICDTALDFGFFTAVDHCHATGMVRGLLCSKCNMALGGFKDNEGVLARAISYLKGSRQ